MRLDASVVMQEHLGDTLRAARKSSDLTVDDVVYRGRIPRAVIEALECEDFGFFTSPLYARSFLRQYGEFVDVDIRPWIDDLVPTALIDSDSVESFIDAPGPDPLPKARKMERPRNTGGGAMAAVWLIVITGALVLGAVEYFRQLDKRMSAAPPGKDRVAVQPPAKETAPPEPEKERVATSQPEAPKRAIIVNLPEE